MVKVEIKNPSRMKIILLAVAVFVLGGAIAVTQYAYGSQVIEKNDAMYMVSHTEYRYGEMGQVVVRLVDFQGDSISVNNCTVSILYPDKSFFVQDALMLDTGNITGDHYYNFTTPGGPEGVYEYQATCNYDPNKQKSATNSFHLSSAFGDVFANLTSISTDVANFRVEVAANFTAVLDSISNINVTAEVADVIVRLGEINATVAGIDSDLTLFISDTQSRLGEINTTLAGVDLAVAGIQLDLTAINTSLHARFDEINANLAANFTNIETLLYAVNTSIMEAINAIDVNLTPILDELAAVNLSLSTQISDLSTKVDAVNLSISSSISDLRQEVQANFSQAWDWLSLINTTTVNAYDYLTGTLADNIDSVLSTLGIINATINRIEQNTLEINETTQQILQNQEDEVFISTYSG